MYQFLVISCLLVCINGFVLPSIPKLDGRIIGGEPADISEVPYQVALLLDWAQSGVFTQSCGGSIIKNNVVLTAGHCAEDSKPAQWRVRAGSSFSSSGGQVIPLDHYILHPDHNFNLDYDVCIFILANPININEGQTAIIPLPAQNAPITDGADALVSGWGSIVEGGNSINELQKVVVSIINQQTCITAYSSINLVTDRMVCAASPGKDACQGDSGGPLAMNGVLFGITSWGMGCARPDYPGVYTRIPAISSWIQTEIANV